MIDEMMKEVEKFTPKLGFNVCGIDEYDPPGEKLFLIKHFKTKKEAEAHVKKLKEVEEYEEDELVIYGSKEEVEEKVDPEGEDWWKLEEVEKETEEKTEFKPFTLDSFKVEEFKTDAGRRAFLKAKKNNYSGQWVHYMWLIEGWIYYGRLAPITNMIIPSLIEGIKSGKFKEEYESILKELNPKGYEKYKKTQKIDPYSKKDVLA